MCTTVPVNARNVVIVCTAMLKGVQDIRAKAINDLAVSLIGRKYGSFLSRKTIDTVEHAFSFIESEKYREHPLLSHYYQTSLPEIEKIENEVQQLMALASLSNGGNINLSYSDYQLIRIPLEYIIKNGEQFDQEMEYYESDDD